jgi:hypothetical protein
VLDEQLLERVTAAALFMAHTTWSSRTFALWISLRSDGKPGRSRFDHTLSRVETFGSDDRRPSLLGLERAPVALGEHSPGCVAVGGP